MTEPYSFFIELLGKTILAVKRVRFRWLILAMVVMLTACGGGSRPPVVTIPPSIPARVWYPMLGDEVPAPLKRTPIYGIQYQANGFDVVKPKQIEKTVQWLRTSGAGHLVDQFVASANEAAQIPEWIDAAWAFNVAQYKDCGGKFAQLAATTDPRTVYVEVKAVPMKHPRLDIWAGGMVWPDAKTIKAVIVTVNGMTTNPATADLRQFKDYTRWEAGNALAFRFGHKAKRIPEDEWGSHVPCSQVLIK